MVQIDSRLPVSETSAASPAPRSHPAERGEVLDKVGMLAYLPDGVHATTEQVARYYEVSAESLGRLMRRHRRELRSSGLVDLRGDELRVFKERYRGDLPPRVLRAARLTVWSRGAILAAGQLLTDSAVAARVRRYLLAAEAAGTVERRLESARSSRFQERADYRNVLHSLKSGGAVSEDYRLVQNTLYAGLFGMTAAVIRATRDQTDGDRRRDGDFTAASSRIAKNYLTRAELELLDSAIVTINAQLHVKHPRGATVEQMLAVVRNAVGLFRPESLRA
ncbi:hypothetical protein, partial [Glycomyces tarimensis]